MSPLRSVLGWLGLIAASTILAGGLAGAGMPAALLLGPMVAGIAFAVAGSGLRVPEPGFHAGQAVLGCLVAHAFSPDFLGTLATAGPLMLGVVLVTVAAGAVVGLVLTRMRVLPGASAAWGSSPGGAAAMVAMSEAYDADPRLVAFMQYVRVVAVVASCAVMTRLVAGPSAPVPVPAPDGAGSVAATLAVAASGAGAALALRLPAGAMLGPMLLGAALQGSGLVGLAVPAPLLDAAYAVIGWSVGLRFTRAILRTSLHALPSVLAATLGLILLCAGWAWGLTRLMPIDFLSAFLATSPGGLDSVAVVAVGTGVDLPFVLSAQTLRLFVVLITGPLLARWIARGEPAGR